MKPKLIHSYPEDAEIHVDDPREVQHWSEEFGVAEQQIRDAVRSVGPKLRDIERELGGPWAAYSEVSVADDLPAWEREGGTDTSEHTGIADE